MAKSTARPQFFPPPEFAGADGLLRVGGRLTTSWLLDAYAHGIFPWPCDDVLAWFSPDPRAILPLDALHVSRRLEYTLRRGKFELTSDRDFAGVLLGCATAGERRGSGTWLTPPMRKAYLALHEQGHAHSVEAWSAGELVGGVYGVALGGLFAAESMFYRATDASKVALVTLVRHCRAQGYALFDIQTLTPHTARFGAVEIPRREYLQRLRAALALRVNFGAIGPPQSGATGL